MHPDGWIPKNSGFWAKIGPKKLLAKNRSPYWGKSGSFGAHLARGPFLPYFREKSALQNRPPGHFTVGGAPVDSIEVKRISPHFWGEQGSTEQFFFGRYEFSKFFKMLSGQNK